MNYESVFRISPIKTSIFRTLGASIYHVRRERGRGQEMQQFC